MSMYEKKQIIFIDESSIFNFINPNENNKLSEMSAYDLKELVVLLDEFYIQLRSKLGLGSYITFGLELEVENALTQRICKKLKETFPNGNWSDKTDSSLINGLEINSPVLKDNKKAWDDLNKICSILKHSANIDKNSGGHIHIGTQTLGNQKESWLNFIKMWYVYENIIFRFAYGEFLTARPNISVFAKPVAKFFSHNYENFKNQDLGEIISILAKDKNQAVNFNNVSNYNKFLTKNTIEFRCPNGTLSSAIWQNNVSFFVNFLNYAKSTSFNDDLIQKRYQINLDKFSNLEFYDEIYFEQALELCDMIFANNLDKVYFLKQYLKSFQICKEHKDFSNSKGPTLVKNRINPIGYK